MNPFEIKMLSAFIHNKLPKEQMIEMEKTIVAAGMGNVVLRTLLQEYNEIEEVDSLIGPDEVPNKFENIEEKNKNICWNFYGIASIGVNNNYSLTKFSKTMETLKLSSQDLATVTTRYNAMQSTYNESLSLKENLASMYRQAHPDATDEGTNQLVERLLKGCDTLTQRYNEALADNFSIEQEVESLCSGKTIEERYTFLINAFALVQNLNLSTFSNQSDALAEIDVAIKELQQRNNVPTEEDCTALLKLLTEAIANNALLITGLEEAKKLLSVSMQGAQATIDFAASQYNDARTKAQMALAMWLEYESGNISSLEMGISPEVVGISAATAIEEAKIMNDVATGSKTADIAIRCLKVLSGVALICLLGYVGLMVASLVGGIASYALLSILGTSTLACIVTMGLIIPLVWGVSSAEVKAGEYIMDKASDAYDFVIEKLRNDIFPKIVNVANTFISWLKEKFSSVQGSNISPTLTQG